MVLTVLLCLVLLQVAFIAVDGSDIGKYPSVDCKSKPQSTYPFCDTSLSPEKRASDLVDRLNISELIQQTSSIAPAIDRLGIKDYNWRSNCLHGWTASGGHWRGDLKWTVFPAPIGLGATFDSDLLYAVGSVTSDEGRALHNEMLASFNGSSTEAAGLNCFSPNVNFLRDPRWGRFEESFSEDPYLLSVQGAAYTKGIQRIKDSKYLKAAACAKHYAVHNGPDNIRATFTAETSLHDLYDSYLEAFKSQVYAAQVAQIMPAYSGFNCSKSPDGAPDAANKFLLNDILRDQFETPNVSIISDNGGVSEVYGTHHFAKTPEEAAALCINATTDLDLGHDEFYPKNLPTALDKKLVTEDAIKRSVWRSFYLRIRLGDFDPIDMVPYQKIDKTHLNTEASQELNVMAAQKSIVLLKNVNNFLPLSKKVKKIAVIGPNADAGETQLSNYQGIPDKVISILDGIKNEVGDGDIEVVSEKGCKDTTCSDDTDFNKAVDAAKDTDYVIMVMGLDGHLEGEGHDRVAHKCNDDDIDVLALPGCQGKLVSEVASANENVIIVIMNGGPLSLGNAYKTDNVRSILEVFYPGALGGTAVANVLFGHYNPAGRMPVTTYTSSKETPDPTNYNMSFPPGRTYRYYTGTPEIPFGFGLSYTTFDYSALTISSSKLKQCDNLTVSVVVTNTGKMDGDEVPQAYLVYPTLKGKPHSQLVGYSRQTIKVGDKVTFSFKVNSYQLSLVDDDGDRYIFPGKYVVVVAGVYPGSSMGGNTDTQLGQFAIVGDNPKKLSECSDAPKCIACD